MATFLFFDFAKILRVSMWIIDTPPNSLMDSIASLKSENNRRIKSWGTLLNLQHFGGRVACWSPRMGDRNSDKQVNYSHGLAKIKQQIGSCVVGAFLVHGRATCKHEFTKTHHGLDLGEATTFPRIVFYVFGHGACIPMSFCSGTPKLGVLKFSKLGLSRLWGHIIFLVKLLIEVKSETKL